MAAHAYALRSKLNNSGVSLKNSPSNSPFAKTGTRSPRKVNTANASLQLQHVIGTTTTRPTGFSCHELSNTYAYCAGATVVLAKVGENDQVSQRFYKARPTASSVNPSVSFYDQSTPTGTPRSRRKSVMAARVDGYGSTPTGSPFREWSDDGNGQTWTARERIKAASSVSISPDGRLLAVGETGYNPRVLIFSTVEDAIANTPLSIMSEHTFGVRAVAFSPDGKYLATLGEPNDGFLFVWSVNTKSGSVKLHSANRCTTSISDMIWCGNILITVGTRHVKAWKIAVLVKPSPSKRARLRSEDSGLASPAPQTLTGRNVLLGNLVDETFTCAVPVANTQAVVCTESGHICLLKDGETGLTLTLLTQAKARTCCVAFEKCSGRLIFGDCEGNVCPDELLITSEDDMTKLTPPRSTIQPYRASEGGVAISAIGVIAGRYVMLDGNCCIRLVSNDLPEPDVSFYFNSHHGPVGGLQLVNPQSTGGSFFTWSASGKVMFWDQSGDLIRSGQILVEQIPSAEQDGFNELKVVRQLPRSDCFISGDRLGILKLVSGQNCAVVQESRAHGSEIIDIAVHEGEDCTLVATSGRDRIVQLFRTTENNLDLVQTLDEHIGAVTGVSFSGNGDRLLSASADRTIVVRDRFTKAAGDSKIAAYLSLRVITLRATPLSMTLLADDPDGLIVSTMDRNVLKLNISTGVVSDAFKVTDTENDDTVILNSICVGKSRVDGAPRLLVGCSSTDKSIRVYDLDREILLTREAGHTEGISDVALREEVDEVASTVTRTIISTGLDGTIMTWNLVLAPTPTLATPLQELSQGQTISALTPDGTPIKPSPVSLPPLRRVLTNMDIAQFTATDILTGSPIQASLRSLSPSRLRRRTSRLTLAHSSIDEDEEVMTPTQRSPTFVDRRRAGRSTADSPSPPPPRPIRKQRSFSELRPQRSRPELRSSRTTSYHRSPSPSEIDLPPSATGTPRQNVGRALRRPPSVPTDLRGQALRQSSRRLSVTLPSSVGASEFGSIGAATEQACRMLRTYRAKVVLTVDRGIDWSEIEAELQRVLDAVRERKGLGRDRESVSEDVTGMTNESNTSTIDGVGGSDVESLRVLLQKVSVGNGGTVAIGEGEMGV
jgi:WD40 repeat protein